MVNMTPGKYMRMTANGSNNNVQLYSLCNTYDVFMPKTENFLNLMPGNIALFCNKSR